MPPLRHLSLGFSFVRTGVLFVAWSMAVTAAVGLVATAVASAGGRWGEPGTALACGGTVIGGVGFLVTCTGLVVGFLGRCQCLSCPEELPRARAAVRLSVLLESCGWLHLFGSVVCTGALAMTGTGELGWIGAVGFAAGVLMVFGGWGFFCRFCVLIADAAGDRTAVTRTVAVGVPLLIGAVVLFVAAGFVGGTPALLLCLLATGLIGGVGFAAGNALNRLADACSRYRRPAPNPFEEPPPCEPPSDESPAG